MKPKNVLDPFINRDSRPDAGPRTSIHGLFVEGKKQIPETPYFMYRILLSCRCSMKYCQFLGAEQMILMINPQINETDDPYPINQRF